MQMSLVMTYNANIIKDQIETTAVKHIAYPQIAKVYVNVRYVFFNVGTL